MEDNGFGGMDAFSLNFDDIVPYSSTDGIEEVDFQNEDENNEQDNEINITEDQNDSEEVGDEDVEQEGEQGDESDSSSSNLYSSLAAFAHEQGLLPSFNIEDNKIKSIDDFTSVMRAEQEAQAKQMLNDYISTLDMEKVSQSKSVLDRVVHMDENYLKDNIEEAKDLIRYDFKEQGLSDSQINRLVDRLVDLGDEDVINEALNAVDNIKVTQTKALQIELENVEKAKAQQIVEQERMQKKIKDTVFETKDLITGYNPTPALKDRVYKSMTSIVGNDDNGNPENKFMSERRKDPIGFETKMYYIYELTDGFTNLNNLGSASKSRAINDLEKAVRDVVVNDTNKPAYLSDKESYLNNGNFRLNI